MRKPQPHQMPPVNTWIPTALKWAYEQGFKIIFGALLIGGYNLASGWASKFENHLASIDAAVHYMDTDKLEHSQFTAKWQAQEHYNGSVSDSINVIEDRILNLGFQVSKLQKQSNP